MTIIERYTEKIMDTVCRSCHFIREEKDMDRLLDEICTECPYEPEIREAVSRMEAELATGFAKAIAGAMKDTLEGSE